MTVSSETKKNTYSGDGGTVAFAFSFPVLDETHLLVQIKDTNGVITDQVITTNYTVSGTGNTVGATDYTSGTVTFLSAPAATDTVIIKRNVPVTQGVDYVENDTFPAETHEDALDKLTMIDQQQDETLDRAVKFDSAVTTTLGELDTPAADQYLKRNSDNDGWDWVTLSANSGLGNLVEDTTPQLGGNLDLNSYSITSPDGTDTLAIVNGTLTIQTNSATRLDITDSGVQLGGSGARVTTVLDEDNMVTNSATALATQQSIKAYVDSVGTDVVNDTTPQLGGDLDMNGNQITSPDGTDLIDIPNGSIDLQTASTSRLDVTDTGVRLGGANARVTTILDEDTMSSDSATALATQQSIKAYVDATGGFTAATQAEQEAATSTTVGVTPGRQQYHPSACKAWINLDGTGTPAIIVSYNITSITDNGTGDYRITFDTDFSSADYVVAGSAGPATAGTTRGGVVYPKADPMNVGYCDIYVARNGDNGSSPVHEDYSIVSVCFFGDQ